MRINSKSRLVRAYIIGDINAGSNVLPFTPRRQPLTVFLPDTIVCKNSDIIVLRVVGDSLTDAKLESGDYLICKTKFELSEIRSDTICAVKIISRNEIAAKKVKFCNGTVTLLAANDNYEPSTFPADDIEILGIAVGGAFYFR